MGLYRSRQSTVSDSLKRCYIHERTGNTVYIQLYIVQFTFSLCSVNPCLIHRLRIPVLILIYLFGKTFHHPTTTLDSQVTQYRSRKICEVYEVEKLTFFFSLSSECSFQHHSAARFLEMVCTNRAWTFM